MSDPENTGDRDRESLSIADRLTDLECWLAHLEQTTEDLSAVILRQDRSIDALTRQVSHLVDRVKSLEATLPDPTAPDPATERPPHY